MTRQVKYELASKRVLSAGNCDFENDGTFDPTLHGIVENEVFIFEPSCRTTDTGAEVFWYYDEENDTFTATAP
jgi:hypothetical protein